MSQPRKSNRGSNPTELLVQGVDSANLGRGPNDSLDVRKEIDALQEVPHHQLAAPVVLRLYGLLEQRRKRREHPVLLDSGTHEGELAGLFIFLKKFRVFTKKGNHRQLDDDRNPGRQPNDRLDH
jgi:hypothetical protein